MEVRIVHVTTVPQSLGFLRGQVGYIQDRGFRIHAISSPGDRLTSFGEQEHVDTYPVELPRRITPIRDLAAVRALWALIRRIRPSIVHAHTPKGGFLGMISASLARTPVRVYHMRGLRYMTATGSRRILMMTTERIACALAHRVFCVSHSIRDVAIRDGICPADKTVVFGGGSGNGVDASGRFNPERFTNEDRLIGRERLGIGPSDLVVGFVGRIVRDKGVEELARAWSQHRECHPTAQLVLTGPLEPQDPVSQSTLDTLHADSRVHLLGHVDDPSTVYPVFDLVVLPTYREGFPNVLLEAAAMELPVVATLIPGCIDAVKDGVTGTLVPDRDAGALEQAIERYLADPELRAAHGKAGRQRVLRDFRQEVIWEAIYQEYVRLLRSKGLPVPTPVVQGVP